MAEIIPLDRLKLAGRWVALDEWDTQVVFDFKIQNGTYTVRAIDSDGEEPQIYDVREENNYLIFAIHWSSGQFTKYRVGSVGDKLEVVFTYTGTIHLKREALVPNNKPNS